MVRYWHGYLSEARCKWFAYGPANATATQSSLCFIKIQNGLPFWCWLTQVVLEKRPLNVCSSSSSSSSSYWLRSSDCFAIVSQKLWVQLWIVLLSGDLRHVGHKFASVTKLYTLSVPVKGKGQRYPVTLVVYHSLIGSSTHAPQEIWLPFFNPNLYSLWLVKVLHPTQNTVGHFWDVLPANVYILVFKKLAPAQNQHFFGKSFPL